VLLWNVGVASLGMVWRFFLLFFLSRGADFWCFLTPFPEEEVSDYIAHGLIIRGFTIYMGVRGGRGKKKGNERGAVDAGWHPPPLPPSPWFKERLKRKSN